MARPRRIPHRRGATAVGAGLGLAALGYGVFRVESMLARRAIGPARQATLDPSGLYGALLSGAPIRLAVIGDSAAAGYGARRAGETFGAFLATGLSVVAGRPVRLDVHAVVGAQSKDLADQLRSAMARNPDLVTIVVGVNDVTHLVSPRRSGAALREVVRDIRESAPPPGLLRTRPPEVVVGTCPDLGTIRPIPPPLRQLARRWCRRLAASQTVACVGAGGHSVSLGELLGKEFEAAPHVMFGPDRFHPSPAGYRRVAEAMVPTVAHALGVGPTTPTTASDDRLGRAATYSLEAAAALAAAHSGAAVSATGTATRRAQKAGIPQKGCLAPGDLAGSA